MKIRLKERKRLISVLMAMVIAVTNVISVVGINIFIKGFAKAATLDITPINAGNTATSPDSIGKYFDNAQITSNGTFSGDDTKSYMYRLALGNGSVFADAYCGMFGGGAKSKTNYTAALATSGMVLRDSNGTKYVLKSSAYRVILAVCVLKGIAAKKAQDKGEELSNATYTAGQLAIWRALYLNSQGAANSSYNYSGAYPLLLEKAMKVEFK